MHITTLANRSGTGRLHGLAIDTPSTRAIKLEDVGAITRTFTGDQRAKLIGIETRPGLCPASARYNTYAWSETTWAADGTLFGGVGQAGFADDLPGTSNSIAARGHRTGTTGLFGVTFGAIEARKRCWRWRREPLRPLNSQGTRAPSMAGVSQ